MKIKILFCLILSLTFTALAQTEKPAPRPVSVTLNDGALLSGEVVKFEGDALLIKNQVGETKIELDKISKIEFSQRQPEAPYVAVAQRIIKGSRALAAAAYDITLLQYRTRIGDLNADLDELARMNPPQSIKTPLVLSVVTHSLVVGAWPAGRNNTPTMRKIWEDSLANAVKETDKAEAALK